VFNWEKVGIDISKVRGGKAFCPRCHDRRKDKKDRSLFVNQVTGVYRCFYHDCLFKGCVADKPQKIMKKEFTPPVPRPQYVGDRALAWFENNRKISNNTLLRMKITESQEWFGKGEKQTAICFNYFRDGKLVNIKFRTGDKKFKMSSGAELIPYNLDAAKDEKELYWVEGEIDALTCIECGIYNVVSVPNGATGESSKLEYIDNSWKEIEHIQKHIICVDDDEAGRKLREALSFRLGAEKCYFIKYPEEVVVNDKGEVRTCKDLNEVLVNLGKEKVREVVANLEQPKIAGVHYVEDVAEEIFDVFANGRIVGETTHLPEFDKRFRWKRGDINLVFGHGNFGKTQFWIHLMVIKSMYDGWRWAIFCPENYPATDFYIDVIEMYAGKHIDDRMNNKMSADELNEAIEFFHEHFIYVYPDDVQSLENIHTIFRGLILKHGIDGVLIDPWNQLDHIIDSREDLYLSKALKEVKKFALVNGISYNIIAHPKTVPPNKDNELPKLQVFHISGGPTWRAKCDNILSVERPDWYRDKKSGWVQVETHKIKRIRTGGSLGTCDFDYFLKASRYQERGVDVFVCDPKRAARATSSHNPDNITQAEISNQWLPYKDAPDTEAPF
jgi:twinkle protein